MKRRVLSLIMALVILLTMLPTSALAQEMETPAAGASVEATKGTPETTAPTTAPTVAVTASTKGSVPATEDSVLSTEGDIAPQNGEGSAVYSNGYVAEINGTPYETLEEALDVALGETEPVEIALLSNVTEDIIIYAATTINMNSFSITGNIDATASLTLKNGTVVGNVTVDTDGTFIMTAPGNAEVAIDGGLEVNAGSCSIIGAKIGVKGTMSFDGDDLVITGTEKAVELTSAAEPASKTFYGSTSVDGETTEKATFDTDTYKVSGGVAKKLTNKLSDNVTPPAQASVTLDSTERNVTAGETVTFTATYTGTGTLDAYIQKNGQDENVAVTLEKAEDGTYTVSAKIDAETPTRDYTLYVHEVNNSFVQAKATIHVTALTPVAEVNGKRYALLNNAFAAANDGDTVTMLANHTTDWDAVDAGDESTLAIVTKKLTLDLNGKTVDYLMVGDIAFDEETQTITAVYPGNLTVMSSREGGTAASTINALDFVKGTLDIQSGQIGDYGESGLTCNGDSGSVTISGGTVLGLTVGDGASVTVSGGTLHGGNWFNDGTLNITGGTFSNVYFNNNGGTIAISGGTFGAITNNDASTLIPPMLLLAKGYAFYDQYDDTLKDGSVRDALKNVTVKSHTHAIENGKCACGLAATVSDSNGDFYNTLQAALDAAAKDSTIQWVQPEQDLTEQVTFDTADAVVTVRMNGKTLTAPNNDAPAVTVSGGTLIFADAATISMPTTADPYNQTITYAVSISGGKLVFQGKLTAEGGVFNIPGNRTVQMPAVYANGGELDLQGDLDLKSGLTISGNAKLTRKLTKGTFRTDYMEGDRLSVTGASNYKYLEYLLEDGYAFVDKDDHNVFRCVSSFKSWSGSDVTIVPHEHTWGPKGELYSCTACGKSCGHPDGYPDGKCPICGKPCPHDMADQSSTDFHYYCRYCGKQMFARIQTDTYKWSFFPNLKDAMAAAEAGQTIVLLDDIDNSDQTAAVTGNGKTVTLDLNGHTITGGWIYVGISEDDLNNQTSSTLKIIGSGSFINAGIYGNLSVGYSATLDLSGWVGENNTITRVELSKNGNEQPNPESLLIVSENIGTIGTLGFYNWPSSGIKTKLTGGTYGSITITTHVNDGEPYSSMLAPGYAFQYVGTGDYVNYVETATNQGNTIKNVKVVKCTHGGTNGFDFGATNCPYCNAPAVAQTALQNVEGDPWRNFADLQTALDADRDGSSTLSLLTDVTGDYTINGTQGTGLDLNGHSIKGTVTVKGIKGDYITTTLSNTQNTTTASIDKVVAFDGAELAGSGYPAVIGELTLAEGATWNNILNDTALGYKVLNTDGTHKWYAPADVPAGSTELKNVIINRLPITSKTLYLKVGGKNLTGNPKVERGTTVQLCAYCNTSGASVNFFVGERGSDGMYSFSKLTSEYKKIGSTWYYVAECNFNKIGEHGIYFTASKDGYSVSSELRTLTVTKPNLSNAVITFPNGNESVYQPYNTTTGVPPYVVTYNGSELKAGVDYTVVRGDSRSTVGTATLTIKATDDGDYTGQKTARWTVAAHKATISVGDIIKVYDGTTDLPANASIKLKSADSRYAPSGGPLPLVAGEDYQILNASYDSANASEDEKTISFTIKLTDRNYTFEDGTTQKDFVLNGADVSQTFKINQATVTPSEITQYIYNDLAKTYTLDLAALLPELSTGCEYGKIQYQGRDFHFTDSTYLDFNNLMSVSREGILTLPIVSAHTADVNKQIGTITVPVVTTNYQRFEFTIKVVISERIPLDKSGVTVSATDITYGQTLAESKLTVTGSMICPRTGNEIPGKYTWTNSTTKPNAGDYEAEWTFTPAEVYEEYAPATGKVTVHVSKAQLTDVSVSQDGTLTYNGQPQSAKVTTTATTVDGTSVNFLYALSENDSFEPTIPAFTDAGTYTVYFYTVDPNRNHETSGGSFTVTIAPLPISFLSVEKISKTYDGTADVTLSADMLTFFSEAAGGLLGIKLPDTALTFSDAQFTMKQADGNYLPSPEAGNGKALSFTMTLTSDNYVFEGKPEGTTEVSDVFATDDVNRFTITKAAAPANIPNGTLNVINGTILDYTYDFKSLLPTAPTGEYGTVNYTLVQPFNLSTGYAVYGESALKFENGVLTLPLQTTGGTQTGKIGTVTVTVTTGNYQDFTLMLDLNAVNKIKLTPGDISCTEITYGQTLNESTITGTMYAVDDEAKTTPIPGTFHWEQPTEIPTNGQKFVFVFIPNENKYDTYTGELAIKVNPKSIEGAEVTVTNPTYDGYAWPYPAGVKVVLDGKTLQYQVDYTYLTLNSPAINAGGSHTVTIQGIGNYTGTIEKSWTIEPRNVPHPTLTVEDGVYNNGNEVRPTITLTDDRGKTIDPKEYAVEFENNTGAGTGTVTITDKDGGNYILGTASTTFTIAKAPAPTLTAYQITQKYTLKTKQTITLPDLESLGMPSDAQVSDANAFHSGSCASADKLESGWGVDVDTGAITYALADGTAAGDVITFTLLVRSKNYEDATVTVKLTLTERDAPVLTLPDSITVDYTGAEIPVSAVTGKRAAFDGKDVPGTWSWKAGLAITNATDTGSKTIIFTPDDPVNYHPVEGTVWVTISPVASAYTAPTAMDGLIYGGNAQALVNAGSTAHGKLLYSLSKDGAYSETVPTGTDAGEYTVWYKVAGDSNHTDTQPASVTVTVAPKTVTATVTVSGGSLTYTGDPLKPDVIVKDGDTVISPEEYDVSYKGNVNAGTATVTVRSKAGGNYTVSGSTTFEIGKAASEVRTAPGANAGLVYNGGEQTLITTGTALGGKLKYRLGESGEFTAELPKAANAGTYTVYYMVEGDGNHRDSEIYSLTVTVGKAKVTVTALDKRIYTDDKAPDLSKPVAGKDYTVTGLFGEDALTGDTKLTYVDASGTEITPDTAKVGKTIIRAGRLTAPSDNYTVVFVDGKLTVDERPVYTIKATAGSHGSITPSGDVDVLHGGSQTFTIAANSGYAISNVKVDGVSIGAVKSYTFENVTENHTIEVTFMKANGNPQTGVMVDEVTGEYYVA